MVDKRKLELCPVSLAEANAFVAEHHRHHRPVTGHKYSIACTDGERIVGVVIVGRPVSRHLDDGWTLEVTRLCTDGTKNGCSMLYAAAWRAARAMGYKRLVTYILKIRNWYITKGRRLAMCGTGRRPAMDRKTAANRRPLSRADETEMGKRGR